jgi:hypothetical protein
MKDVIKMKFGRSAVATPLILGCVLCGLSGCGAPASGPEPSEITIKGITLDQILDRIKAKASREELQEWLAPCVGEQVDWVGTVRGPESESVPGSAEKVWLVVDLAEAWDEDDILARNVFAAVPSSAAEAKRFPMGASVHLRGRIDRIDTGPGSMKSGRACYFILSSGATVER